MAAQNLNCVRYQLCDLQGLPLKDLIAKLFVVDGNGCYHLNTVTSLGNCNGLSPAIACATGEDWEVALRKSVVLDDCGLPAISIFVSTNEQN
jgi:hypothetical protein